MVALALFILGTVPITPVATETTIGELCGQLSASLGQAIVPAESVRDRILIAHWPPLPPNEIIKALDDSLGLQLEQTSPNLLTLRSGPRGREAPAIDAEFDRMVLETKSVMTPSLTEQSTRSHRLFEEYRQARDEGGTPEEVGRLAKILNFSRQLENETGRMLAECLTRMSSSQRSAPLRETITSRSLIWLHLKDGTTCVAYPTVDRSRSLLMWGIYELRGGQSRFVAHFGFLLPPSRRPTFSLAEYGDRPIQPEIPPLAAGRIPHSFWAEAARAADLNIMTLDTPDYSGWNARSPEKTLRQIATNYAGCLRSASIADGWLRLDIPNAFKSLIPWTAILPKMRKCDGDRFAFDSLMNYAGSLSVSEAIALASADDDRPGQCERRRLLTSGALLIKALKTAGVAPKGDGSFEFRAEAAKLSSEGRSYLFEYLRSPQVWNEEAAFLVLDQARALSDVTFGASGHMVGGRFELTLGIKLPPGRFARAEFSYGSS